MKLFKKKRVPTFDELKNKDLTYRYSREERLRMRHDAEEEKPPLKGIVKLFGGNKGTMIMFFFFVVLASFIWVYYFFYDASESLEKTRVFKYGSGHFAVVKLIDNKNRHGLNIGFENKGKVVWQADEIQLSLSNYNFVTNYKIDIEPKDYDVLFISTPLWLSNISRLDMQIE
jgi:hypothetical protein